MRFWIFILSLIVISFCGYFIDQQYKKTHSPYAGEKKVEQNFGSYIAASVAQKTGDYDNAIKSLEKSLIIDPDNTVILEKLYALYLFEGEYKKAIEQAQRNIEIDIEKNVPAEKLKPVPYLLAAIYELKEGDPKKITEILGKIERSKADKKTHLDGVVIPLMLAWGYAINEDFPKAFKVIDGITADYMLAIFSYNRAIINDIANNKDLKIPGFKKPTIKEASLYYSAEIFSEIGQYSLQQAQFEEAAIYIRIAKYLNDSYKYTKILGVILETQNRFDDAIKVYSEVSQDDENYNDAQLATAIDLSREGKNDEAVEKLEEVAKDKDFAYMATFTAGTIYLADDKFEQAIKKLNEAEKYIKEPSRDNWSLYFNLGVAYDKISKWDESEKNLVKAVQLFPENPEALNYLAYSWLVRNKNINQARKMLESAVIRSGGASHILDSYGWALFKMGYYKQSLPFLEQASASIPYNSVVNAHLGDLYWKLGRHSEAKFLWQRAIDNFEQSDAGELSINDLKRKMEQGL